MILKSIIYRILSLVIATVMVSLSGFTTGETYTVKDPDTVKTNFTVLSDSHVETNNLQRYKVFSSVLQNVNRNENGNDAVVFLGDNTMNGQILENLIFHGSISLFMNEQKVLPVIGNHDIGNGEGNDKLLQKRWYSFTNAFFGYSLNVPYYYEVINGCYFIVIGSEGEVAQDLFMTEEQFTWLENVLALASESGKPVFMFCHYPARLRTPRLTNMLAEYSKTNDLFYFAGHSHTQLRLWSFDDDFGYHLILLPCLTDPDATTPEEISAITGIGVEVELYENELVVRGRNFYTEEWLYDGDVPCEMTYQLKNPITD